MLHLKNQSLLGKWVGESGFIFSNNFSASINPPSGPKDEYFIAFQLFQSSNVRPNNAILEDYIFVREDAKLTVSRLWQKSRNEKLTLV